MGVGGGHGVTLLDQLQLIWEGKTIFKKEKKLKDILVNC